MGMSVLTLPQDGWIVCACSFPWRELAIWAMLRWRANADGFMAGLNATVREDGVWRIRKKDEVPAIEVFKVEESGCGDILSKEFIDWRCRPEQAME